MSAAHSHEGWGEHARRELARTGHRAGGAREQVLALLERQPCCLSAQEIHDRLRAGGDRPPGLASVYRALEILTSLRLVHRLDVGGTACFEPADPSGDHHHHAICEQCGKRDAFADPELEKVIDTLAERLGYQVGAPRRRPARTLSGLRLSARLPTTGRERCNPPPVIRRAGLRRSFRPSPVFRTTCPAIASPAARP